MVDERTEDVVGAQDLDEVPAEESHVESSGYGASQRTRFVIVGALVVLAFFAAYGFASARNGGAGPAPLPVATSASGSCDPAAASACGGECGGGSAAPDVQGAATLEGDVQRLTVDVSSGSFVPNIIFLQQGVPAEITFTEGSGCLAEVMIPALNVREDLTSGGATVEVPALAPGEIEFSCGMEMVFGLLVVQ